MSSVLSREQVSQYRRDGFLFPLPALSKDEAREARRQLEALETRLGGALRRSSVIQPHLHFRWAYELVKHERVLEAVESIIGPDILVHTTSIFSKSPRDAAYVAWHQDGHYWRLGAPHLVSAWIALSDSRPDNGCMRVIPGTHSRRLPHNEHKHSDNMLATGLTLGVEVDEPQAVDVTLKVGEMSLHHVNAVHGSSPNRSGTRRIGFAIRYVSPEVSQRLEHHAVVLVRGCDHYHNYTLLDEPPSEDIEVGLAAQVEFTRWLKRVRGIAV
jgi:ectoine hydroxylase-related dioxygenase (phytanoyl-CoA dioxygenase family)